MKKRKKTLKQKKNFFSSKNIIVILTIIVFSLTSFIGGFLLNENRSQKEIKKYKNTLLTLQEKINKLQKQLNEKNTKTIKPINFKNYKNSEIIDLLTSSKDEMPKTTFYINKKTLNIKKPKLVIIIDDVAFKREVQMIKQIPLHITPSFFPPTKRHPFTPFYAKEFPVYMVHIPMEAMNYPHPEPNTMNVNWNYLQIKNRIEKIKKEFPNVYFINNHTGSKFTSNYNAMKKLFKVLKEENLAFVDSKTTPYSKSKEVDKIYHIPLLSRNIFLDNEINSKYIRNQLKKAVKIAQKRGYAIAIGHPHKITLMTIKNATDILKNVDVVYINELEKYAKN